MLTWLNFSVAIAATVTPVDRYADVKDVMLATSACLDSTSTKQARTDVPLKFDFTSANDPTGPLFKKAHSSAIIRFNPDQDGVQRTCTVYSEIAISNEVVLRSVVTNVYKSQQTKQSDSTIWLFQRRGMQGLQMFSETRGDRLSLKIIAATFVEPK